MSTRDPGTPRLHTPDVEAAVAQARREERISARLDNHEADIRELRDGQAQTTHALAGLTAQVTRIEKAIGESAAAAKALAEKASNSLTTRQLYIALGGFLVALGTLIVLAKGVG